MSTTSQEKSEEHTNIKQEPMDIECDTKAHLANSRQIQDSKNKNLSEWKHCRRTRRNKIPDDIKLDESDTKPDLLHCEICEKIFENNLALGLHTILHNNGEYSCHMCKYTNASKDDFEMHIRVHEGTAKYRCEICKKAFRVQAHAIEHKYFHTGEKPCSSLFKFDCPICFKHYTSASKLKRHNFMEHNAEVSPLCDICGKTLSSKEALKFHRRIHTGYKPHVCSMCPKAFTRKEQLREHERVHTGEKPYICKYCGKGFSQKTSLTIHERIHTGERPYVCRLCNKGFVSKGVMDTHMKSCDGGIPIK